MQQIKFLNIVPEFMSVSSCPFITSGILFSDKLDSMFMFSRCWQGKGNLTLRLDSIMFGPVTSPIGCHFTETCTASFQIPPSLWSGATGGRVGFRKTCWVQSCQAGGGKICLISLQEKKQSKWEKAEPPVLNDPQSDARITGGERKIRPVVGQNYTKWPCWESSCSPSFLVLVPGRPQWIGPSALRITHQHVAAEKIPRGSTSCGPPDKARSGITTGNHKEAQCTHCHHHCNTAALQ